MILRRVFIAIGCVLFSPLSQANSSLGEVNIELRGNVVDFTCAVVAGDSNNLNRPARPSILTTTAMLP